MTLSVNQITIAEKLNFIDGHLRSPGRLRRGQMLYGMAEKGWDDS